MWIKAALTILGLFVGLWMVVDGCHVLAKGKYIGPEKPGPWSHVVRAAGLDPMRMGVAFVALGAAWLVFTAAMWSGAGWAWAGTIVVAVATLWYLPVGTVVAIVSLVLLILFRGRLIG